MTNTQDTLKQLAAEYAIRYITDDITLGVGTGSTTNHFIKLLADSKYRPRIVVASSEASAILLKHYNIEATDLNTAGTLDLYIDGADEINALREMIKGGGAALTREKIVAASSRKFICIADESKLVKRLGSNAPVPVEVIPMARSYVARQIVKLGGIPDYRQGVVTDNGNVILDVHNLNITEPIKLESELNSIAGVVENGIFARRAADELILACADGNIQVIK